MRCLARIPDLCLLFVCGALIGRNILFIYSEFIKKFHLNKTSFEQLKLEKIESLLVFIIMRIRKIANIANNLELVLFADIFVPYLVKHVRSTYLFNYRPFPIPLHEFYKFHKFHEFYVAFEHQLRVIRLKCLRNNHCKQTSQIMSHNQRFYKKARLIYP